jgi:hypothetical protein
VTRLVPRSVREQIVAQVEADADSADWNHLAQADKSAMIARWVAAPSIGGVLLPLLGSDAHVRLWVKDVALKRRARSLLPGADAVVAAVFGSEASVVPGSPGIKPAHCVATIDGRTWYVCWDRAANAKHLLWAALQEADSRTDLTGALAAFVESVTDFTPEASRARIERIAAKCGVKVRWVDP